MRTLPLVVLAMFLASSASSQSRLPTKIGPIQVSGGINLSSEYNDSFGVESRRDPFISQAQFNVSAQASRFFSYGLNATLSSQRSSLSQSFNRAGLNLRYRWIAVSGGNVTPTLSPYSLQGVTFSGALVELTPGPFLLTVTGGKAADAVEPGSVGSFLESAYERRIYAVRIGLGSEQATHFHLVALQGKDEVDSIGETDSVRPSENISLSPDLGFSLFKKRFKLRALGTVSAFTRDSGQDAIDLSDTPAPTWLSEQFAVTPSTQVDFAVKSESSLDLGPVDLKGSYERVQPGFESMGLARPRTDFEKYDIQTKFSLAKRRVRLGTRLGQTRNNLLGLLTTTRYQRQYGLNAQVQLGDPLSLGGVYNLTQNEVVLGSVATRGTPRDMQSHTVTLSPTLTMRRDETGHNVALSGTYQWSADLAAPPGSETRTASDVSSVMMTINYGLSLPSKLTINTGSSMAVFRVGESETTSFTLTSGANQSFRDRAVSLSVNASVSLTDSQVPQAVAAAPNRVMRQSLNSSLRYRIPFGGDATLALRASNAAPTRTPAYQEVQVSMTYTRKL